MTWIQLCNRTVADCKRNRTVSRVLFYIYFTDSFFTVLRKAGPVRQSRPRLTRHLHRCRARKRDFKGHVAARNTAYAPEKQTQISNNLKLKNRERPKRNSPTTKTIIQPSYNTPIPRPSYLPLDGVRSGRRCFGSDHNSIPQRSFNWNRDSKSRTRKRLWIKWEIIGSKTVLGSKAAQDDWRGLGRNLRFVAFSVSMLVAVRLWRSRPRPAVR